MIRKSWGSPKIPGVQTRLAFMIGYPPDEQDQQRVGICDILVTGLLIVS